MPSLRIRGQEIELAVLLNGEQIDSFNLIKSFDATIELETQEEGYLGETSNRFDEIFKGISGKADCHIESQEVFNAFQAIIDRARRRDPALQVNIKATLNFPNGDRPKLLFPDVYFGAIPLTVGGRSEYVQFSLDFKGSEASFLG